MSNKQKTKKIHIEFLRILAIFFVLFNHTETKGYTLYTLEQGTIAHWLYLMLAIFVKIAVPIFFMISGALLLSKEETIADVLKKRVFKMLLVLIGCHLVNYVYFLGKKLPSFSFMEFFERIYAGRGVLALWYLYAYLGFLLILPFLRMLVKYMKDRDYHYLIMLYLLIQLLYIFQYFMWQGDLGYNENFFVFTSETTVFYPLLGYYIENCIAKKNLTKDIMCKMIVISLLSIFITCLLTKYRCGVIGEWEENSSQKFFECFIFIPAATVYLVTKYFFENHSVNPKIQKLIITLGGCSFGIYLFENIYRVSTEKIFYVLSRYLPVLLASVGWIACACCLGMVVTLILKKIPVIKKFI